MFSKTLRRLRHTLALRLTVWYAVIFAASSVLAFLVVYGFMVSIVQQRTDDELKQDIEDYRALMATGGLDGVRSEVAMEAQGRDSDDVFVRLWSEGDTQLLDAVGLAVPGQGAPREVLAHRESAKEPTLTTLEFPDRESRVRVVYGRIGPGTVLEIGRSLEHDEEFLAALRNSLLATFAAVILLGGPIGWFMARRALRGVEEVTRTATEIADGALDRRVTIRSRGDELETLARTFNTMLDRIQALITGMREVTDNLAHDFRSPLARLRASAEMAMNGAGADVDLQTLAASTTEECDRLLQMIDTTLDIAEAESGAARMRIVDVDLVKVVLDACDVFGTVAEDRQVSIATELPERCDVRGDLERLQRVIANLLDNALKYTAPGGRVTVRLIDEGERVRVAIEDNGIGVPAADLQRIFQRFYRCDESRSGRGNGLGLSLALAFVRAHGGDIAVDSTPGSGSTFTVALPRSRTGV